MKVLGITGGIATGKSLVTKQFKDRGFPVYDADQIVHELYNNPSVIESITSRFPSVNDHGQINRKALGELVFNDILAKSDLEQIFHPLVYETLKTKINQHLVAS